MDEITMTLEEAINFVSERCLSIGYLKDGIPRKEKDVALLLIIEKAKEAESKDSN